MTRPISLRPTIELAAEPLADPHYLPPDPKDLLHADPSRRESVRFASDGISLAGHLYRPSGGDTKSPALVMCGPFSSVKELYDQDPYVTQAAETVLEWLGRQLRR